MITNDHRIAVLPGTAGIVMRSDDDLIVLGGRSADLVAAIASLDLDSGLSRTELVRRLEMARDIDVAAIVSSPDGFDTVAVGNGSVTTPDGRPPAADAGLVWVGIGAIPSDAASRVESNGHLDLQLGCVPGQGALIASPTLGEHAAPSFEVVDLGSSEATDPRAPLPVAAPAASAEAPAAPAPPGPPEAAEPPAAPPEPPPAEARPSTEVMGIRCSRDHFNNPRAAYCQVCGISMVHITHYLVPGPRPTLGFLVFDDGATFALDRSYTIGREPRIDPERDLSPLVLRDERHSISRSHAELVLDGWDLVLHDLGSTNGSFVWNGEFQQWNRVMPDQPVVIEPGTSVAIGRKVFVYEAVARSV